MTEAELNRKFNPMEFQQTLQQLPQYVANRPRGEERDLDPSLISRFTPAEDIASAAMQEEVASDQRAQKAAAGNIPVSYTHLDVYKRQPLSRKDFSNRRRLVLRPRRIAAVFLARLSWIFRRLRSSIRAPLSTALRRFLATRFLTFR